jgi:hypothetical protein
VQPRVVLAVGRVAEAALEQAGVRRVRYVRHPAHGGGVIFEEEMRRVLA